MQLRFYRYKCMFGWTPVTTYGVIVGKYRADLCIGFWCLALEISQPNDYRLRSIQLRLDSDGLALVR